MDSSAPPQDLAPRKLPKQRRSRELVDALVEATARVLAHEGYAAVTSKRISAVAGVSIGSLYQYFPNKDALVFAVVQRHFDEVMQQLARVSLAPERPLSALIADFVDAMVRGHRIDPTLHKALTEFLMGLGPEQVLVPQRKAQAMVRGLLESRQGELRSVDLDMASWLMVVSTESAVHAALMEEPSPLQAPGFSQELSAMLTRYICR